MPGQREGAERLLVLVNAPANGDVANWTREEMADVTSRAEAVLADCGLKISLTSATCRTASPAEFAMRFPGSGGSLYGQATHGLLSTFARPGSRSRVPGLFLAGGTVHPGPGVPMATLSGRLAARAVLTDSPLARGILRPLLQTVPKSS